LLKAPSSLALNTVREGAATAKELLSPVLMQANSHSAGKSSGKVQKKPYDWETWGFACQLAKKVVSRWIGRRIGSWG